MPYSQMSPMGLPGRRYAFLAKAAAVEPGEYRIYAGPSPANLTLVDSVAAGVAEYTIAQANSTTVYYEITAVSASGVESDPVAICVEKDAEGNVTYARPNVLAGAWARAAAGGTVRVTARYQRLGEPAAAAASVVQVAPVVDGSGDWDNALGTMVIDGLGMAAETFDDVFSDGQTVHLAARASTGGGSPIYGPEYVMAPIVADSTAPDEVTLVMAEQA